MKITFLGAVEEVTGSKYLIEHEGTRILVDCGLFQGSELSKRNWNTFPIEPRSIDAVVLTHAHIDHSGYIPVLVKNGFKKNIYCSEATFELCSILLVDSGLLQEEDAENANKLGYSSHRPALPLYTEIDAKNALKQFHVIAYDTVLAIGKSLKITFIRSSHILGSSFITVSDGKQTITFSGDLGRPHQLVMKSPTHLTKTDFLIIESTYGNKLHGTGDPIKELGEVINKTASRGGVLIIPSFAVGRTQTILYCLYQLKQNKSIPNIPIFLDSPMAINVTDLLCKFKDELNLSPTVCIDVCSIATYTRTREESKHIDDVKGSSIIIAASGMATGGRVSYHLKRFISDPKNTILFVGFQEQSTPGRALVDGAKTINIHGEVFPVHAEIRTLEMLSAHADYNEILEWMEYFKSGFKKVFVTHGELEPAQSLKKKIEERFGCPVVIPKYLESFKLD